MESNENDIKELIHKIGTNSNILKPNLWLQKGKFGREIDWEVGIGIYIYYYIQSVVTRTYYTVQGNLFNTLWQTIWGKNLNKNGCICICMADSLCCTPETITTL